MKLDIELVPETAWNNNMRSLMGREAWDILRKKVYKDFHYRCGICGKAGKLDCHEQWVYDDTNHTQTLKGFIALCELCHAVKHIGLSSMKNTMDAVIQHYMTVNKCDRMTFEKHKNEAFLLFEERSKHQWQINIGEYTNINTYI
jgi:hypothetical protein